MCTGCLSIGGFTEGTPPPNLRTPTNCDEPGSSEVGGTVDFGGIMGNADAPIPPLPPDLVAVSDYIEFEFADEGAPNVSGFVIPLTEEIAHLSTIGFYTYEVGEWRRVADVTTIRDGRAEGEFTSFPANIAVLKRVP